jgi:hypothetical protein
LGEGSRSSARGGRIQGFCKLKSLLEFFKVERRIEELCKLKTSYSGVLQAQEEFKGVMNE